MPTSAPSRHENWLFGDFGGRRTSMPAGEVEPARSGEYHRGEAPDVSEALEARLGDWIAVFMPFEDPARRPRGELVEYVFRSPRIVRAASFIGSAFERIIREDVRLSSAATFCLPAREWTTLNAPTIADAPGGGRALAHVVLHGGLNTVSVRSPPPSGAGRTPAGWCRHPRRWAGTRLAEGSVVRLAQRYLEVRDVRDEDLAEPDVTKVQVERAVRVPIACREVGGSRAGESHRFANAFVSLLRKGRDCSGFSAIERLL